MNPFFAFILGGFLFGGSNKTVIVQAPQPEPPKPPKPTTGKCHACTDENCPIRAEYGFPACDFCYEQYKKYSPIVEQKYISMNDGNYN